MQRFKLILFDLDGTLLNTIADLAHSTNYALALNGFPTHPIEAYRFFVGNGINKLFERVLPENERTTEQIARVRAVFLPYYNEHNTDYTQPYDGIETLLRQLRKQGYQLAVASNKYQQATEKLIDRFFPDIHFVSVFGQRDGVPVKPDPAIVRDILKIAHVAPAETIYIGDSGVDIQTAINSGVVSIGVTWGFRPREELEKAGADHVVDSINEILAILSR
jgi:phosphoglycolate phosphatase